MFLLLWWNTMTKETFKKINWDYYFRGLESIKVKQGHGSKDIWEFTYWPISRRQIEDYKLEILNSVSHHIPSPTIVQFLMFPKQYHQLVTKCYPHSNQHNTKQYVLLNKYK